MDKLKYIKLENEDGSYSDSIPLAVDSDYVDVNGSTLTNELANKASTEFVNSNINNLNNKIKSLASGSPLVASSISEMIDTSKIYVNTTDGNWYYYDGNNWEIGGIYQSTSISEDSINEGNFIYNIQNNICNYDDGLLSDITTEDKLLKIIGSEINIIEKPTYNCKLLSLNVNPGEFYTVECNVVNDSPQVTFVDEFDKLISYINLVETTDNYKISFIVPSKAVKMYINSRYYRKTRISKLSISSLNDNINTTKEIKQTFSNIATTENITEKLNKIANKFYNVISDRFEDYPYSDCYEIECKKGDIFRITSKVVGNMSIYSIFNKDNLVVQSTDAVTSSTELIDYIINVDNINANKIVFNNNKSYSSDFKVEKITYDYINFFDILNSKEYDFEIENLQRRCKNIEDFKLFTWKPFDKAYFAFIIDDCNSFTPTCANLFKELEVPLGCAVITSQLDTIHDTANGKTIKQVLQDVVLNGGEILAHYSGNLADVGYSDGIHTFLTSDEDWKKRTRDVKLTLEKNGFKVSGIIRADSTQKNSNKGQEYCEKYFDYSDNLGISKQFNLGGRKFFMGVKTVEDMKSWIDDACNTPGFYPFCLHGNRADEPLANVDDLTEIINYIKSKSNTEITTYNNIYNNFRNFE